MKAIAELAPTGRKSLERMTRQSVPAVAEQTDSPMSWFDEAFRQICLACPAWRASLPDADYVASARKLWIKAFAAAGLTDKALIQKGINKLILKGQQYLISPAEFIELCQPSPEDFGITPLEDAYKEALKKAHQRRYGGKPEWSHVVVKFAAGRCLQDLLEGREPAVKERFTAEYKYAFEQFRKGELGQANDQLTHQDKDKDVTHYRYLLKQFGNESANQFLAECAKRGKVINTETGAVSIIEITQPTKEEKDARISQSLAEIRAILDEPKTSARMARGGQ